MLGCLWLFGLMGRSCCVSLATQSCSAASVPSLPLLRHRALGAVPHVRHGPAGQSCAWGLLWGHTGCIGLFAVILLVVGAGRVDSGLPSPFPAR